jgi:hypothetical protein
MLPTTRVRPPPRNAERRLLDGDKQGPLHCHWRLAMGTYCTREGYAGTVRGSSSYSPGQEDKQGPAVGTQYRSVPIDCTMIILLCLFWQHIAAYPYP